MELARILLLEPERTNSLRSELADVLRTQIGPRLESKLDVASYSQAHDCTPEFLGTIARTNPHLILVAPPLAAAERVCPIVEALVAHSAASVVVVVAEAEAAQLLQLSAPGVLDIVGRPLRAVDILPRMWRLVALTRAPEL